MHAILSIKPQYTDLIFRGLKTFEYRRAIFKQQIHTVVVYASAPTSLIIGEFRVEDILHMDLDDLWRRTQAQGGVSEAVFYDYFAGKDQGYAIQIGKVQFSHSPRTIQHVYGVRPPQSFMYVPVSYGR